MSAYDLLSFGLPVTGQPELSHPKPDRLIAGNPLRETWNALDAPLIGAQSLSTGVWRCEPGHWAIAFGPTERECSPSCRAVAAFTATTAATRRRDRDRPSTSRPDSPGRSRCWRR